MRRFALALLAATGAVDVPAVGQATAQAPPPAPECSVLAHRGGWNQTPPSWSADGRWVAHVDWRGGLYHVIVASAGGGRSRVLHTTEAGVSFRWSPRGARMVVYENEEMFLAGPGLRTQSIASGCFGAWLPDGKRIVFAARGWISTGRVGGWNERRLVAGHAVSDVSRDGKRIAFVRRLERPTCHRPVNRLFVLRLGTRRVIQVTGNSRIEDGVRRERAFQVLAHFSADGRHLAFAESRPCDTAGFPEYETPAFITDLASRRVRQVGRGVPTWGPRSSRLGVQAIYDHPQLLTVVTPSGRQVASFEVPYGYAWSPDGTKIVQEWTPEYAYVPMSLYVRGLGGRGRGRLLAQNADEPSWSADGRRVAFVRHDHTCRGTEVHVVGVTSRRTRKVIDCRPF